ncbi:hypothetical protein ACHAWU_006466 [Discostella pseudostelligera]|uniref:Uncharacterized protein n=1 Tax=Discostella pseudostelligera TaxID=259834 RepID=A0ABD3N621_9STRA
MKMKIKSTANLASFLRITILLCLPNEAVSSSSGQYSRASFTKFFPIDVRQAQSNSHRTTASIAGSGLKDSLSDDFASLNAINKYGGHLTRDSIYEAVAHTKMQRPSQDIVILGVASWN